MLRDIPKPSYVLSEPHLSGYRVVLGYETLSEAQDAQQALTAAPSERREPTREEIEHAYQQGYGKAVFNDEGRIKAHNAGLDAILTLFRGAR